MKYYLIAGERSGDLHGSHLIKELLSQDPDAEIRCWGGDLMEAAGGELVVHYKYLAFMGIWEVITNLLTIRRYLQKCKSDLKSYQPDVVVLIDYPGFNMKIAEFAHNNGWKVCYYISPKLWAWNQGRATKIKKYVHRLYSILPFEKQFYSRYRYDIEYVGNPLVQTIGRYPKASEFRSKHQLDHRPLIAVLPGSRKQEINHMLGVMLELAVEFPQYNFVVAAVDNIPREFYGDAWERPDITMVTNVTYDLLSIAEAALVASGTASLETALFEVPQIVCYKTSWLTYWVGRVLIKVPYLSLVNLIANKLVVPELIQDEFRKEKIAQYLKKILENPEESASRHMQLTGYREVKRLLGNKKASQETARLMVNFVHQNP